MKRLYLLLILFVAVWTASANPIDRRQARQQAEKFLKKLEEQLSKDAIDHFYEMVKPINGCRWYDKNPTISKTVEILRVVPPEVQRACAERFISALKEMGVDYQSPNAEG
jgi:hypothetical protein